MEYFFKNSGEHIDIFKDDFDAPIYRIQGKSCTCPGCVHHKVQCKHLRWLATFQRDYNWQIGDLFCVNDGVITYPWRIPEFGGPPQKYDPFTIYHEWDHIKLRDE